MRLAIAFFVLSLAASAQAPPSLPPADHFECWHDSITEHFTCMSAKGSILDVESALAKLDEKRDETKWGGKANGSCLIPSGLLMQVVNQPTALDDISRADFAEAAQKAADETDGKPLSKLNCTMDAFTHEISPPECAAAEPIHRICHLRQMFQQGDIETYTLDCIPEVKP
jgi:hypothetical protein